MNDEELKKLIILNRPSLYSSFLADNLLPDIDNGPEVIRLPAETVARFREQFSVLLAFAAHICDQDHDKLCVENLLNAISRRGALKRELRVARRMLNDIILNPCLYEDQNFRSEVDMWIRRTTNLCY